MVVSSKPFTGIGIAYSRREEAEPEGQHEDVQHEVLLCAAIPQSGAREREIAFSRLSDGEVPPGE
jgi:hypothetical protein